MQLTIDGARPRIIVRPVRATIAALCANLVGIGIARFGYTPLLPAIIAAGWFAPSAAAYLGAANLAGYLAGAVGARLVAARLGAKTTLRSAMLLTAISLFACAFPLSFGWFFVWRFVSGGTGGVLMALAAPTVIAAIPPKRRGVAGGVIFTGVGLGIAASGTLVPLLIRWGLFETWIGFGGLALVLTALSWTAWPANPTLNLGSDSSGRPNRSSIGLQALYLEYALNAVGLVPHMVFLVDYVARDLGRGIHAGSLCWITFGMGAVIGPLISGHIGDRIGFRATLRWALLIQAVAVAVVLIATRPILLVSSFIIGAFVPGIVAITIGRTRELIRNDPDAQTGAWGYCTTAFAIGQGAAAYAFSYIYSHVGNAYPVLFVSASMALVVALSIDFAANVITSARAYHGRS